MKRWILAGLIFVLYLIPPAHAAFTFDRILEPYQWLDLSFIYDKYGTIIDLLVYTLIFVGAAQVSLGQRFPGNSGRAMGIGTGLALALGMILAERQWNFSLVSFGPFAAAMLALVSGVMIYRLLRYAGLSRPRSAAAACLLIFFTLLLMAPGLFDWLHGVVPAMNGLLTPLLALSLILLFWPRGPFLVNRNTLDHGYHQMLGSDPLRQWTRQGIDREKRLLRHTLRPRTRRIGRKLHDMGGDLDAVANDLRRRGRDPRVIPQMVSRLESMRPKANQIGEVTQGIKGMLEQLKQMDQALLAKQRRESGKRQNRQERRLWEREIKDERLRLEGEIKTSRLEELLEQHAGELSRRLAQAVLSLREGRVEEALSWVEQSKASKRAIEELLALIQRFEEYLLQLVRRDARIEKRLPGQLSS